MKLLIDPLIDARVREILDYWKQQDRDLALRLSHAFEITPYLIGQNPERGRRIPELSENYRRMRVAKNLPGYVYSYRYDKAAGTILIYLLRHEVQRPYSAATHRRKANEAQRRVEDS